MEDGSEPKPWAVEPKLVMVGPVENRAKKWPNSPAPPPFRADVLKLGQDRAHMQEGVGVLPRPLNLGVGHEGVREG